MLVILKEDMPNLGFKNEIVEVKPGYGRNFLIPQGKAVIASASAVKVLEENLRQQSRKLEAEREAAQKIADRIEGTTLKFVEKTSATGRIYGSVGAAQVAEELEKLGFENINRKMLVVPGNIKEVGEYVAKVRLHKDVTVEVPFTVESDTPVAKPVVEEVSVEATEDSKVEAEEIDMMDAQESDEE